MSKAEQKERKCLKCQTKFLSKWIGNRICPPCAGNQPSADGLPVLSIPKERSE